MSSGDLLQDRDFTIYRRDSRNYNGGSGVGNGNTRKCIQPSINWCNPTDIFVLKNQILQTLVSFFFLGCSRQYRRDYRILSTYVRENLDTRDLYECESRCINERSFECSAFAFKYNTRGSNFRNDRNCELSDQRLREGLGTSSGGVFGTGSTGSTENELSYDRVGDYIFGDIIFDS